MSNMQIMLVMLCSAWDLIIHTHLAKDTTPLQPTMDAYAKRAKK